ncbi:DASH complex, subunit Dad1 [Pseudohyphozyma bogoriensis]|nr:DASH complex, subunit Dad1 [Pseudohyphozyma bogoriensis]
MDGRADFESERARLVAEIAENLARCVTNVNQLNRNIENVSTVGAGFAPVHNLWKQFEAVMASMPLPEQPQEPFLKSKLPPETDETAVVGAGVAPGGGAAVEAFSGGASA